MTLALIKSEKERVNENLVRVLEEQLERARSGELTGILIHGETTTGYEYTRCNLSYEHAIALCARTAYRLNQDWDRP